MKINGQQAAVNWRKIILKIRYNRLKIFEKETFTNLLKFANLSKGLKEKSILIFHTSICSIEKLNICSQVFIF